MTYFYSTRNKDLKVSLETAVLQGLADDGGLFMPCHLPRLPESFFNRIKALTLPEISFEIAQALLKETISPFDLKVLIEKALTFDAPLKRLMQGDHVLELFHGPTLSFKDFGACFMAQLMGYFVQHHARPLNILAATSGDTGSAIAQAFLNVPGIKVWILYPHEKVSWSQEKQLTTMGHNITALEVRGTFDDCQQLVKQAFADQQLREQLSLTSANSINIARLIPQSFYYFYAYAQLEKRGLPLTFSVPSGNFGSLTAGLLAKKMGLPITQLIAATNINDSVPAYLHSGTFQPHPSRSTLSNAMDVGNPSNFERMLCLYEAQWEKIRTDIKGVSFTDDQTREMMRHVCDQENYLLDPHGAVAYLGLKTFSPQRPENRIFLETAHPAKFAEDVERITAHQVVIPDRLQHVLAKEKQAVGLNVNYEEFRALLLDP